MILGGGFAGLAAGVALAGAGKRVRLLEQRPYLGGRARSFRDPRTGSIVDNGQHVIMGCYHETLRFLQQIGTLDCIRFQPSLKVHFLEGRGRLTTLACPRLPAPWHLLVGVLQSASFRWREKLEVLRLGRALDPHADAGSRKGSQNGCSSSRGLTVDCWLESLGQSERLRRNFWDLLAIAALNEDPRLASAALFERVLRLALFTSTADSRIGLARGGLSECYTEAARTFIESRGGSVETGHHAAALLLSEGACFGVKLSDGNSIPATNVISALPWTEFLRLLPTEVREGVPFFARISALRPAPIISINLWFDREVTRLDFAGLRGSTVQWLFNKRDLLGSPQTASPLPEPRGYLSLVVSGAHALIDRTNEELLDTALADLARLLPATHQAKLLRSMIIKERLATFSPSPEAEESRPSAPTPVRRLYLAGDWTSTGLPATIEGAVKSGYTAARETLAAQTGQ